MLTCITQKNCHSFDVEDYFSSFHVPVKFWVHGYTALATQMDFKGGADCPPDFGVSTQFNFESEGGGGKMVKPQHDFLKLKV